MEDKSKSYHDMAMALLKEFGKTVELGTAIIGIWSDEVELKKWQTLTGDENSQARIAMLKLDFLPMIEVSDRNTNIVAGVALGKEEDYSDTILLYHVVANRK